MEKYCRDKESKENSTTVPRQVLCQSFILQQSALTNTPNKKMQVETKRNKLLQQTDSPDLTDSTDIIECSIEEHGYKHNFAKSTKQSVERDCELESCTFLRKGGGRNLKKKRNSDISMDSHDFIRTVKKEKQLLDNSTLAENYKTPSQSKNNLESSFIMKKIFSSIKKTPEGSYLSKSKLRNIENWLSENKVEVIRTPPFANLSVTPLSLRKKEITSRKKEKRKIEKDSSIDSEVEDVLKAVYGDDWMKENVNSKSKTNSKRKPSSICSSLTKTKGKHVGSFNVRRNILTVKNMNRSYNSDEEIVDLESSYESGIQKINFNDSNCSEELTKLQGLESEQKTKRDVSTPDNKPKSTPPHSKVLRGMTVSDKKKKKRTPKNSTTKKNFKSILLTPKKTFLASLSVSTPTSKCHPEAQFYKMNFKSKKDELIVKLYKLYNSEVFDGKLAADMNFSWNIKLRGTAGYCYNKRITKSTGDIIRTSRIEFSTKIVDRADRLRDTMIHELCHAASWIIDGKLDGHGIIWNKWASKAMSRFPELPKIKRCHNYKIVSKYVYRCTGCGYTINRHSKSIDVERKRCGYCYGILELLVNKKQKGKSEVPEFHTTKTLRTPNKFALFVKENYQNIKISMENAKHADIMKVLSQKYAVMKSGIKCDKNS